MENEMKNRKDRLEVRVYMPKEMADIFTTIAHKQDKTRSMLFGEIITDYLRAMANGMVQ